MIPIKSDRNNNIFLFLIGILFICGGLGIRLYWVQIAGFFLGGLFLLFINIRSKNNILLPPEIFIYLIFIFILFISFVWSKNFIRSLEFFYLFCSGGFFWVLFYNLKERISVSFSYVILVIGLIFFILFLLNKLFNINIVNSYLSWNIYGQYTVSHNHIGDYWVIAVLALVNLMLVKTRPWHFIILLTGIILIAISLSRSAFIALFVGLLYFFLKKDGFNKYKKFYWPTVLVIAAMFIVSGFTKTTFFSRPYFFQIILGLLKNPFGVGMGNFREMSNTNSNLFIFNTIASHTHNIFLEVFSGIGLLGTVFVFWFIKILSSVFKNKEKGNLVYQSIFLAITANFLFDTTYYLPVMLWLWFVTLGLAQKNKK